MSKITLLSNLSKSINKLTLSDYHTYPVWLKTDNLANESEVTPAVCEFLPNGDGPYYLFASFCLADKTEYEGFIRLSANKIIRFGLAISDENFVEIALQPSHREMTGDTFDLYAFQLGRGVDEVFPLYYRTKISLLGQPIEGVFSINMA